MDLSGLSLPVSMNPNNFPAKLWRMVNNPFNRAICWTNCGQLIIIDQQLLEVYLLSASSIGYSAADAFKTTNYSSFGRQLNLYGFKKVNTRESQNKNRTSSKVGGALHHFHNPNFKQNKPELLLNLRRLTVDNKAKLEGGVGVNKRRLTDDSSSPICLMQQESTPPCHADTAHPTPVHNGTAVPPCYQMRRHAAALSPSPCAPDKDMPVSLSQLYTGVAYSHHALHIQQGLLAHANNGTLNFNHLYPQNAQSQPGYYSPGYPCCCPNLVASCMTGCVLQTGLSPSHLHYRVSYPNDNFCLEDPNMDLQKRMKEELEVTKCDVNLETVFAIADEGMQTLPSNGLVSAVTPEKASPVLEASFTSNTLQVLSKCDFHASPVKDNPLSVGHITVAVSGSVDPVTYELLEDSVVSVSEQIPADICEVTSEDTEDSEFICVDVSINPEDTAHP